MAVSISIAITQNSQSITNNTSSVTVKVNCSWTNGSYNAVVSADGTPQPSGTLTIDGKNYTFNSNFNTSRKTSGSQTLFTKTVTVSHASDGTKKLSCSASFNTHVSSGTVTTSASKTLTTIPRKSTLTVGNGTLGIAQTLTVTRKSTSFTHTIIAKCGTASTTICTKSSSTSISFTPPIGWSSQNTTGTSVSVTYTITTYNGTSSVGSNAYTKTCSIPSSVKPTCTVAVSDATSYYETYGAYVKGYSKFKVTVTPKQSYSSPIASYKTTANGSTYTSASFTTGVLKSSGTLSVSATVTDKRGRTSSAAKATATVLDYSPPAISKLTVGRCDLDGTANDQGEYVKVTFAYSISDLNGKNKSTYTLQCKKTSETEYVTPPKYRKTDNVVTPGDEGGYLDDYIDGVQVEVYVDTDGSEKNCVTIDGVSYEILPMFSIDSNSGYWTFAADTGSSYDVVFTVTDNLSTTSKATSASTAFTLMHWKANGLGMGIGKVSEEDYCLDVGFKLRMSGGLLPIVLEANTDLNEKRDPGMYVGENVSTNNYANCPLTDGTFTLEVISGGSGTQVTQRLVRCHKTERQVYERTYYSNKWGDWHEDWYTGWKTATLSSAFENYYSSGSEAPKYRRSGNIVEIRGTVKPTADILYSTTYTNIFTLPEGYRPDTSVFALCQGSGNCTWLLQVNNEGGVGLGRYREGETSTTAKNSVWLPFHCTFLVG